MGDVKLSVRDTEVLEEMLFFYRAHPVEATEDILGIKLSIHQGIMLKSLFLRVKSSVLFCGRGVSKTFVLAIFGVLCCLLFPYEKILFVGPGFRQSKELMLEAERIVTSSLPNQEDLGFARESLRKRPGAKGVIEKSPDAWRIEFADTSYLLAIPLSIKGKDESVGGADSVRGYRANRLLLDETKDIPQMIIDKILRPTTVVSLNPTGEDESRENQIVYSGTIDYESNHFGTLPSIIEKSSLPATQSFRLSILPTLILSDWAKTAKEKIGLLHTGWKLTK